MNVSALASAVSANAAATVQSQASMLVLKKALAMQQANALQLLQALPQPAAPSSGAGLGRVIDTFA